MTSGRPFVRIAAYAVIVRAGRILLCRLAPRVTAEELWTLPGGGLEHGEDPRTAVIREIYEETGLLGSVGETARVFSTHVPSAWRNGELVDAHALRLVYQGWVPIDAPEPRVVEVDGSTVETAWVSVADVRSGQVPAVPMVLEALEDLSVAKVQRVAAYAVIRRDDTVLLVRVSVRGGRHAGSWSLPGGGLDHGESPEEGMVREVREECGVECTPGALLGVHHRRFTDVAPGGREEDFSSVDVYFAATLHGGAEPHAAERDGSSDDVAWVSLADISSGRVPVLDVVRFGLTAES